MSKVNVEVVRRLNALYNERSFAASIELIDPDLVWDMSRMPVPENLSYSGLEGLLRFLDTWWGGFATDRVEIEDLLDAGDQVLAMVHHTGQGRTSGVSVDQRYAMVWTLREGRAVRMDMYPTGKEALAAVAAHRAAGEKAEHVRSPLPRMPSIGPLVVGRDERRRGGRARRAA